MSINMYIYYFLLRYSHTKINLVFSNKKKNPNMNMMSDLLQRCALSSNKYRKENHFMHFNTKNENLTVQITSFWWLE